MLDEGLNEGCEAVAIVQAEFFEKANVLGSWERCQDGLGCRYVIREEGGLEGWRGRAGG